MTVTILLVIIIVLCSYLWYKQIHKYHFILYPTNLLIAIILSNESPNYITFGFVSLVFFTVVMFAGVLDKGVLRKRLLMIRAELAVLGTIYIIPHFLAYTELVLEDIGLFRATVEYYIGLIIAIILIPLTITSFPYIRKQMNFKQWKKLHLLAYGVYGLIAIHLIIQNTIRIWLYVGLFLIYLVFRLYTMHTSPSVKRLPQ
ncbi:ferric reductase-like transmembrane domain-containing protein [Candidatus Xianfuyuplasma coldseepsis]|uniref:Ferric oxidoreductase domain-containing protein n=1 Tax=Candidatus Xianfuyuplasma coldseepsis TaxID=2782163 RepID=A0A7L7KSH5_9MOLU|nr:ferric reductase-like transmembrane domain-containing protein [Xianfuyuplasma coldseepsis]QMS85771.1 hypothetical protein G4Z02_08440 [Xianfuyuplasma coldseepsis]